MLHFFRTWTIMASHYLLSLVAFSNVWYFTISLWPQISCHIQHFLYNMSDTCQLCISDFNSNSSSKSYFLLTACVRNPIAAEKYLLLIVNGNTSRDKRPHIQALLILIFCFLLQRKYIHSILNRLSLVWCKAWSRK